MKPPIPIRPFRSRSRPLAPAPGVLVPSEVHVLRDAPPRAVLGVERVLAQVHEGDGALHALQGTRLEAHRANGDGEPMLGGGGVFVVDGCAMGRRRCGGTASGAVVGLAQSHEGQGADVRGLPLRSDWVGGPGAFVFLFAFVFVFVGSRVARRRWRAGHASLAGGFIVRFDGYVLIVRRRVHLGIERDTIRLRRGWGVRC